MHSNGKRVGLRMLKMVVACGIPIPGLEKASNGTGHAWTDLVMAKGLYAGLRTERMTRLTKANFAAEN